MIAPNNQKPLYIKNNYIMLTNKVRDEFFHHTLIFYCLFRIFS